MEQVEHLSGRQERFCQEYIIDWNGTQAAIRAGYAERGAGVTACRLLKMAKIQRRINQIADEALGALRPQIRSLVISKLRAIAQQDVTRDAQIVTREIEEVVRDENGKPTGETVTRTLQVVEFVDTKDSPNKEAIASIKQNEKGVIEVKYHDPQKSLELLGRYGGLWNDKLELTGPGGGPIQTVDHSSLSEEDARRMFEEAVGG